MTLRRDVVIIGDGPAGSALAGALGEAGIDALLVGRDEQWTATYGGWVDDVDTVELGSRSEVWAQRIEPIRARFDDEIEIHRPYGVLDNESLRRVLRSRCDHLVGNVSTASGESVELDDGTRLEAHVVVDAAGWPARFAASCRRDVAWQTAFGVVLHEPPAGPLGSATLMDFAPIDDDDPERPPTFAYSIPLKGGWLVEETVLAARPAVEPARLAERLARRLSTTVDDLVRDAVRVEEVRIPMGAGPPDPASPVLAYGAAGGMIQPATGYSVTTSIRAAESTARALADHLRASARRATDGDERRELADLHRTIWPDDRLRTRALHDFGLDVLLRLDGPGLRQFFGAFFSLGSDDWSAFLRADAAPGEVARVMVRMFAVAPWSLRAQLVRGNPRSLVRLVRR